MYGGGKSWIGESPIFIASSYDGGADGNVADSGSGNSAASAGVVSVIAPADIPPGFEPSLVLPLEAEVVAVVSSRGLKNFAYARLVVKTTTKMADTMTCNIEDVGSVFGNF